MSRIFYFVKIQLLRLKIFKRNTDVYIVSYPKSGRTWLKVLIGKAICLKYGLPDELMLDTHKLTTAAGILRTHFSHDFSEILSELPYDRLPTDKTEYANQKVIFIARDIKDVLVSSYFQATKRTNKYRGPISDFIRSEKFGVKKVITFYNIWHTNRHVPRDFLLLSYEEVHGNPEEVLAKTLHFIGIDVIDGETLKEAIAFASFNNMKKMEAGGYFKDSKMRPANAHDAESFKVRRGIVEGYRAYLSEADVQYIDQTVEEIGCPFMQTQPVQLGISASSLPPSPQ